MSTSRWCIKKYMDNMVIDRNLNVGRRLLRVFSHVTGGDSKELAIKQVVAPRSKIRKSDKFFGILFAKKFTQGFCLKNPKKFTTGQLPLKLSLDGNIDKE